MIKTLIGIRMRSFAATLGKKKDGSNRKLVGMIILYAFLALLFVCFSLTIAVSMAPVMIAGGLDALYFSIFMLAGFTVVFLLSIFETKSELFECRDNELLLAMPIRPHAIVIARLSVVLIINYAEYAIVFFPAVLVYLICGGVPLAAVGSLFVFLLLPLLATSFSAAVGYLVARISKKIKNNSLVTTVLSLAFLALYFFGYSSLMGGFGDYLEKVSTGEITEGSPFLIFIGEAALMRPIPFLAFLAVSLAAGALAYFLISRAYFRIVTATGKSKRAAYREKKVRQGSPFTAMVKKELLRYTSSATYMLNSGIGLLFELGVSIYFVACMEDVRGILSDFVSAENVDAVLPVMGILVLTVFSLCTFISGCTLSLEGKAFSQLRALPISAETVLFAKTMPHLIVTFPFTVVTATLFALATHAPWYYVIFLFLTPTAANLFCALFGMVMNVAFPRFDYENEAQVIKQSTAMFICTFGQMIFAVLLAILAVLLTFSSKGLVAVGAITALFLVLSAVMYILLVGPSARRYEKL